MLQPRWHGWVEGAQACQCQTQMHRSDAWQAVGHKVLRRATDMQAVRLSANIFLTMMAVSDSMISTHNVTGPSLSSKKPYCRASKQEASASSLCVLSACVQDRAGVDVPCVQIFRSPVG